MMLKELAELNVQLARHPSMMVGSGDIKGQRGWLELVLVWC